MKHLGLTILTYVALVLQSGAGQSLSLGIARPEFLSAAWAVVLLTSTGRSCLLWAGLIGLLDDCLTDQPLGIAVIVFVLAAAVAQRVVPPRSDRRLFVLPPMILTMIFPVLMLCAAARILVSGRAVDLPVVLMACAAAAAYATVSVTGGLVLWRIARRLIPSRPAGSALHRTNRFRLLAK